MLFGWIIALSSCHVAEFAQQHWSNNTMLMLTITFLSEMVQFSVLLYFSLQI